MNLISKVQNSLERNQSIAGIVNVIVNTVRRKINFI